VPIIICFVKKIIKYFYKIADSNTVPAGYVGSLFFIESRANHGSFYIAQLNETFPAKIY